MKNLLFFIFYLTVFEACAQQTIPSVDSIPDGYFVTRTRTELMQKFADLHVGIKVEDSIPVLIQKLERFITNYKPQKQYPDDIYSKESILQTLIGFKEGGYGIGAVLVDSKGNIIFKSFNSQIQRHRSDLHAEMTLLSDFEESPLAKEYTNVFVYKPGLTVYSSTEPCPMCFIRMAAAGVNCKYCSPGPDDGMKNGINCLPPYWKFLSGKYPSKKDQSSPLLQKIAHLMFYSYLLDNRGPVKMIQASEGY